MTSSNNNSTASAANSLPQILISFKQSVIEQFQIMAGNRLCNYQEYLTIPETSDIRHGDEANAIDQQFTRYILEWLGFNPSDWTYNQPQAGTGKKLNRPDYQIRGSIGVAFILEEKIVQLILIMMNISSRCIVTVLALRGMQLGVTCAGY